MGLDQIGITVSGVIAVWLTQDKRATWRRWACIFGMLAQPFWFYAAWKAEQWGIFAMCTLYTYAWTRGLWVHWLSPYSPAKGHLGSFAQNRQRRAAQFAATHTAFDLTLQWLMVGAGRKDTDSGRIQWVGLVPLRRPEGPRSEHSEYFSRPWLSRPRQPLRRRP